MKTLKRNAIVAGAILGLLVACAEDEPERHDNQMQVLPTTTRGSVVGRVETYEMQPIEGAEVEIATGTRVRTVKTDAEGRFVIPDLPGGSELEVRIRAEGYLEARTYTWIPNEAGDTPLNGGIADVGTIGLVPSDGKVVIEIFDRFGALLAPQNGLCRVDMAFIDRSEIWSVRPEGRVTVEARFEDGRMICEGLPNLLVLAREGYNVFFSFPAIDVDGDGEWDYEGIAGWIDSPTYVFEGMTAYQVWPAPRGAGYFASLALNWTPGRPETRPVPRDRGLEIVFNQPIVVHHLKVRGAMGFEDPEFDFAVEGTRLRVFPAGTSWPQGALYMLDLDFAPKSAPYEVMGDSVPFLTSAEETPTVTATFEDTNGDGAPSNGEVVRFEFSQALAWLAPTDFPGIFVEVNADVDGSGTIGDYQTELDYGEGVARVLPIDRISHMARTFEMALAVDLPANVEFALRFDYEDAIVTSAVKRYREVVKVRATPVAP